MWQRALSGSGGGGGTSVTSAVQSTPQGQATQTISIPDSGITEGIIVAYTYVTGGDGVEIGNITGATIEKIANFNSSTAVTYTYDFAVYKVTNITSQTLTITFSKYRGSPAMTQAIFIY